MKLQITIQTASMAATAIMFMLDQFDKRSPESWTEDDTNEYFRLESALIEINNGGVL